MQTKSITLMAGLTAVWLALSAHAGEANEGYHLTSTEGSFADVAADLHDAVVNRGLVIDFVGRVGDMLSRTGAVVEMENPFSDAEYFHFCSAKTTHAAVAAAAENIAVCPYVVFAYVLQKEPGKVWVGYRRPRGAPGVASEAALGAIDRLLREIVDEAVR